MPPAPTDVPSIQGGEVAELSAYRARSGRCWRCGVKFSETTLDDLARCTALAREQEGGTA